MKTACRTGRLATTRNRGFTLIELMTVIAIMAVLASLLLVGIGSAIRFSRKLTADREVQELKQAWEMYFQTYRTWPAELDGFPYNELEIEEIEAEGDVVRLLQGEDIDGYNVQKMLFMQFQKFSGPNKPVNPWGKRYFFKLDVDLDNEVAGTGNATKPPSNTVRAKVVVWTLDDEDEVRGSWMR